MRLHREIAQALVDTRRFLAREGFMRLKALLLCGLLAAPLSTLAAPDAPLRVAVASNFAATLAALVDRYVAETGESITTSSASTGALYAQVIHGAPFDLLLAADSARPARLQREGLSLRAPQTYALGQLVLAYQPHLADTAERGIGALLSHPGINLAIANPELAPYGVAAEAVLARTPTAQPRLLTGANVSQAMQMWVTGGADAAFVAASFQPAQKLDVPPEWYPAIEQQALVLASSPHADRAQALLDWLTGPTARNIIRASGYSLPGDNDD